MVAFADFALIRRWRATFPTRGKTSSGCAKSFSFYFSILLLNRHCIYRLRTAAVAFPRVGKVARQRRMSAKPASVTTQSTPSGCAKSFSFYFSILLLNRRCIYRLRTAAVAFPRVGKVAPQATDEGESGERSNLWIPCRNFPPAGKVARQRRMRANQASALFGALTQPAKANGHLSPVRFHPKGADHRSRRRRHNPNRTCR